MGVFFVVVFLIIFGIWGLASYNGIIRDHNRAQRAWSDVLTYERQKTKILEALEDQASSFKEYEANVLKTITGLRAALQDLSGEADGTKLSVVRDRVQTLMSGLNVVAEAYPNLGATQIVQTLMHEITEQQEEVGAAVAIFNRGVEVFNTRIEQFPGSLINSNFVHKSRINPYTDSQASAAFEYKPNF